jgi:hypothetical protein
VRSTGDEGRNRREGRGVIVEDRKIQFFGFRDEATTP